MRAPVVVLTRSREDNASLRARLQAAGVTVLEVPTAELRDVPAEPDEATVRAWCGQADAIAFTSRHGVEAFERVLGVQLLREAKARGALLAAVGRTTAEALQDACLGVDVEAAEPATGSRLAVQLADTLADGAQVLLVQGRHARPELAQGLQSHGLRVLRAVVYENAEPPAPTAEVLEASARADLVYLAAPSAADRLLAWAPHLRDRAFAAIGPTTAGELSEHHGITVIAVAPRPDEDAVLRTLLTCLHLPI